MICTLSCLPPNWLPTARACRMSLPSIYGILALYSVIAKSAPAFVSSPNLYTRHVAGSSFMPSGIAPDGGDLTMTLVSSLLHALTRSTVPRTVWPPCSGEQSAYIAISTAVSIQQSKCSTVCTNHVAIRMWQYSYNQHTARSI